MSYAYGLVAATLGVGLYLFYVSRQVKDENEYLYAFFFHPLSMFFIPLTLHVANLLAEEIATSTRIQDFFGSISSWSFGLFWTYYILFLILWISNRGTKKLEDTYDEFAGDMQ